MNKYLFKKWLGFALLILIFNAQIFYAITRNQVISNAQTYINIYPWTPIHDSYDFVQGDPFYTFYSQYKTLLNGGYSFPYYNYPITGYVSGPPYPIVAYVYGGCDAVVTYSNRILYGDCPGGYNTSTWYLPLSEGGFGFGQEVPDHLAGIDCSGYVTNCWGMTGHPYATSTLDDICLEIDDDRLKPGDILNKSGYHVVLFYSGNVDTNFSLVIYQSQSTVSSTPPGVILCKTYWLDYGDYISYSIFPQFSGMDPLPDTTLEIQDKIPTIKVIAEGSINITNAIMWLDGESVTPTLDGKKKSKTIKYEPTSLAPGKHYVKVQCSNVVNGIAYDDTISWSFRYGIPEWYDCYDNINGIYAYKLVLGDLAYTLYSYTTSIAWNWSASISGVDTLTDIHLVGIYDFPHWVDTGSDTVYDQPLIEPISTGGYNIAIDGNVISSYEGVHLYEYSDFFMTHSNRVLCSPTDLHNLKITNPSKLTISYIPPIWPSKYDTTIFYLNSTGVLIGGESQLVAYATDSIPIVWSGDVKSSPPNSSTKIIDDYKKDGDENRKIPTDYSLNQGYPNPFTVSTSVQYSLKKESNVTLKIYNLQGQLVKILINEYKPAGYYEVSWNGTNDDGKKVSRGVYLYRITAGNFSDTKKLILLR